MESVEVRPYSADGRSSQLLSNVIFETDYFQKKK